LRTHAFQASWSASSSKPGRSAQRAGSQRLLPCTIAPGGAPSSDPVAAAGARAGACGGNGTLLHAVSIPTMAAIQRTRYMLLILLEEMLALVVLVAIVWWTMFSGRKRGEL